MTGKRFTYDYEDDKYYDKGFFKDNGNELYKDELLELLNTLHEENEQLRHDATILIQSNQDYRKENEELKQQIHYLKIVCRNELDEETLKQVMGSLGDFE